MIISLVVLTILVHGPAGPGTAASAAGEPALSDFSTQPVLPEDPLEREMVKLRMRGQAGDPEAQASLGIIYYLGVGVPMDLDQAQFWLRKAAEQGHPGAQVKLAAMCFLGQGTPVDLAQSADWFRKAADQGEPHAQACLGVMCASGVGVPQDLVEAYAWLLQAQAGGVADGADTLLQVKHGLSPGQIEEGTRRALEAAGRRSAGPF